jgi:hypothetical protein
LGPAAGWRALPRQLTGRIQDIPDVPGKALQLGQVPTFIEILEEIAGSKPVISIPADEVERLAGRFGDRVRLMGRWNVSTDGSLDIPISVIREAATDLGSQALQEALTEIKAGAFTQLMESSAAVLLIEKIRVAYDCYFRQLMNRYQNVSDPGQAAQLRDELVREVFGG